MSKRVPPDAPFQTAHFIQRTYGVHAHRLKTLALARKVRTIIDEGRSGACLYSVNDVKALLAKQEATRDDAAIERHQAVAV